MDINKLISGFINTIFPPRCLSCKAKGNFFCQTCQASITGFSEGAYCPVCMFPLNTSFFCPECRDRPPAFIRLVTVGNYSGVLKKLIHLFKYHDKKELAPILGNIMAREWEKEGINADYIVAVPMHKERQKKRGYNHVALLVDEINKSIWCEKKEIIIRIKKTDPQYGLSKRERFLNIKDSFILNPDIDKKTLKDKRILIIDDIFTSGYTVNEACKVISGAPVKEIYVLTLSRTTSGYKFG